MVRPPVVVDSGAHHTIEGRGGEPIAVWEYAAPKRRGKTRPPTVVLAHGWTLHHMIWVPFIERLQAAHNVRVIAYDQPGHGGTPLGSIHRPTIRGLGDTLLDVLEATTKDEPVILVGHSMGGMAVMAFAGAHPEEFTDQVRGVLLLGTSAGEIKRRYQGFETLVMRAIHRAPMIPTGNLITQRGQRHSLFGDRCKPEDLAFTVKVMTATPLPTLSRYYLALMEHDEIEHLGTLAQVPTTIMCGEKDRLTSTRHARRVHEGIRGSRLVIVPGAGHMLMLEALDLLAIELGALLHSV